MPAPVYLYVWASGHVGVGATVPAGALGLMPVGSEDEAHRLVVATCSLVGAGVYRYPGLGRHASLVCRPGHVAQLLAGFAARLAEAHARITGCTCALIQYQDEPDEPRPVRPAWAEEF